MTSFQQSILSALFCGVKNAENAYWKHAKDLLANPELGHDIKMEVFDRLTEERTKVLDYLNSQIEHFLGL